MISKQAYESQCHTGILDIFNTQHVSIRTQKLLRCDTQLVLMRDLTSV